ncbi:MAG: ATP-binding cassette domain-containing protein [Nanoarchaeota archaeon]|nr:ATP-binding cassette domain-containing protein [Nanoarchaeota archaeon]
MSFAITVENLSKSFKETKAVKNISFQVPQKKIFAFLGPNGAGKSTTIKMMTTLLAPDSGSIVLEGVDALKNKDEARQSFGIVFQDQSLDDELTTLENLEYHAALYHVPKELRAKRIKKALEIVDLWDRKDALVKTFSGGMKRRLEIGRSLIHYPKILFLDEPTTGLDPQTRNSIWSHIKQLNKEGMTIFFTTHYMPEVEEVADEVAIIDHGKIITQGSVSAIKKQTKTKSLEAAFLKLTGKHIREESASKLDGLRQRVKVMRR